MVVHNSKNQTNLTKEAKMSIKVNPSADQAFMLIFRDAWQAASEARRVARGAAERRALAKAFNNLYCYQVQYEPNADRLGGTALSGLLPPGGNRWMCPDCNRLHAPTECSVFSGLQYPACCTTGEGNRLTHGVRISSSSSISNYAATRLGALFMVLGLVAAAMLIISK